MQQQQQQQTTIALMNQPQQSATQTPAVPANIYLATALLLVAFVRYSSQLPLSSGCRIHQYKQYTLTTQSAHRVCVCVYNEKRPQPTAIAG